LAFEVRKDGQLQWFPDSNRRLETSAVTKEQIIRDLQELAATNRKKLPPSG